MIVQVWFSICFFIIVVLLLVLILNTLTLYKELKNKIVELNGQNSNVTPLCYEQ